MTPFIGRENELKQLSALTEKQAASLVVIRGRRRIGKSRLIEEFARQAKLTIYAFSGLPPESSLDPKIAEQEQLLEFSKDMQRYFHQEKNYSDWSDAFYDLATHTSTGKILILLDEITWMANASPSMLGKLKNAWDKWFKKNDQLILVLCGSVSTWIKTNIINSTGFFGRISIKLHLRPLPLYACKAFWGAQSPLISAQEKLKILSVTGGIPKYLEEINPKLTAEENIKNLCFTESGILFNDFYHIFSAMLEKKSDYYRKIAVLLSGANLEQTALLKALDEKSSSNIMEFIEELIDAGLIERHYTWLIKNGKDSTLSQYRLSDNYIRFYLKYIYPNSQKISDQQFQFKSLANLPGWQTMIALQVENLVLNNRHEIIRHLDISPDDIINAGPYFQRSTKRIKGCQIDLLIQTKLNTLYVCEIKFSKNMLREEIIEEVQSKINGMALPKGFSVRPVLIHASYLHDKVMERNYFSKVIDLADFL